MFVNDVTSGGAIPLLEKTLAFAEARNRVLATNIANITTPGYRAKQLDLAGFQKALAQASEQRRRGGSFELPTTSQFLQDDAGMLKVTPTEEPVENVLFQDGTNARIESQMSQLAENTLMNQVSAEMLKGYYDGMGKAIRGRV